MSKRISAPHPIAARRASRGWSQEELATRAGIPRSSVSAIEAGRLTPSVTAALAVASALECSVEELFGKGTTTTDSNWAWQPGAEPCRYWEAEVGRRRLLYPVEALPGNAYPHDGLFENGVLHERADGSAEKTLVLAGCDPAAGLLAAEYAALSGFRLLTFSRGGGTALDLLRSGAVHVAALHRSTADHPSRNAETVLARLGSGYRLLRSADWEEGIALPPEDRTRSVNACVGHVRRWALREPGSSARECLDELHVKPRGTNRILLSHAAVAEVVRSGWAEAGVCVRVCADDAGLNFLPVRTESLDLCFAASLEHDPRIQALIRLLRSRPYRRMVNELPGYRATQTGELTGV